MPGRHLVLPPRNKSKLEVPHHDRQTPPRHQTNIQYETVKERNKSSTCRAERPRDVTVSYAEPLAKG